MSAPVDLTPDDSNTYARRLTVRNAKWLCVALAVSALAYWPLDYVLFGDDASMREVIQRWRIFVIVYAALNVGLMQFWWKDGRYINAYVTFAAAANSAVLGDAFGHAGELATTLFHGAVLIPLTVIFLQIGPLRRAAASVVVSLSFLAMFFRGSPHLLGNSMVIHEAFLMSFSGILGVGLGHVLYAQLRKNYEQQLALDEKARELEELDQLKNDFFANVSHELRTPLTLILGTFRELSAVIPAELESTLAAGKRNAARLLVMIEELLELARFTSGRRIAKRSAVDVRRLVREVSSGFQPSDRSGQTLTVEGCEGELIIDADPRQLRTAIHNLISNAHKFTDPSSRRIQVSVRPHGEQVAIQVGDNGIGIPEERLESIFERFFQVDSSVRRERGGIGIGLALVQDTAKAHGGSVEVQSEVGEGSTFTLTLPIGAAEETPKADGAPDGLAALHALASAEPEIEEPGARGEGQSVVVAEDDPELRQYITRLLATRYRVIGASDGEEALERVRSERPALLVCDVMMPRLGGLEVARILREDASTNRLPVLFLTARAGTPARVEAYDVGGDDFLTKPFDPDELLARVANLLKLRSTERELEAVNESLEKRVAERTEQLHSLTRHMEASREQERQRLARDLHDETGQLLTALRMDLDSARDKNDNESLRDILERMDSVLEEAFVATRDLVGELRPRILDDLGLGPAVDWYMGRFEARTELAVHWEMQLGDAPVPDEVATAVFRVLQEALTNVVRHSDGGAVEIELARSDGMLTLRVVDDGAGFDPANTKLGFGVLGMQERAHALGGELSIGRGEAGGTELTMVVPIRAKAAA